MVGIVESVSNLAIHLIENMGYWGVFIGMTLESACIPIPSEIIMTLSGFVAYEGKMTLLGIILVALGNLFGSLIAYMVGLKGNHQPYQPPKKQYHLQGISTSKRCQRYIEQ